jgi:hypothetical protein
LNDEQFRKLSWKMIGLSNILSLMNVTKGTNTFMPHQDYGASKMGGINDSVSALYGTQRGGFSNMPGQLESLKTIANEKKTSDKK